LPGSTANDTLSNVPYYDAKDVVELAVDAVSFNASNNAVQNCCRGMDCDDVSSIPPVRNEDEGEERMA